MVSELIFGRFGITCALSFRGVAKVDELFAAIQHALVERRQGPFGVRIILQPVVAIILAIRDGIDDAKMFKSAYLWGLFTLPEKRIAMIRQGWRSIAKVFIVAILIDVVYQLFAFRTLHLLEAVALAVFLAILPYAMLRGPANRVARLFIKRD